VALTDIKIRALKPRDRAYQIADGRGLVIEVMPGGAKVWRFRYRQDGKPQKITIGHYPEFELAKARLQREELRIAIADGRSPAVEKAETKQAEPNSHSLITAWSHSRVSGTRRLSRRSTRIRAM
jgi:hypothetical protein